MAHWKEEPKPLPWLPVHDAGEPRESVAPSKPVVPARGPAASQPVPITVDDPAADIIPLVLPPPPEEIMPTDDRPAWDAVPVFAAPSQARATPAANPIQSLGDAAVRRATLSASGAPTPLGGVAPPAPSSVSAPAPITGEVPLTISPYQPKAGPTANDAAPGVPGAEQPFLPPQHGYPANPPAFASAHQGPTTAPGFMARPTPTNPSIPPHTATPEIEENVPRAADTVRPDELPVQEPVIGTAFTSVTNPGGGDTGDNDEPPATAEGRPWWRSWPFLTVVGLVVLAGVGYVVATALSDSSPEPVELTTPVIVPTPEEPTHESISIEDPSSFQAALPELVGPFALTGFEEPEVATLDMLEPVAEADLLTYQYQDITLSVRALQHFDAETALRHFDALAVEGDNRTPVSAGAIDVGERVNITAGDAETIVWRNSTAIFLVTGPIEQAELFFTQFPF